MDLPDLKVTRFRVNVPVKEVGNLVLPEVKRPSHFPDHPNHLVDDPQLSQDPDLKLLRQGQI